MDIGSKIYAPLTDAFHYAKPTGHRDQWEYPRKMERHFPIWPDQRTGMILAILMLFPGEFSN